MIAYFNIQYSEIDANAAEDGMVSVDYIVFNDGSLQITTADCDACFEDNVLSGKFRGPMQILADDYEHEESECSNEELHEMFSNAELTGFVFYADEECAEAFRNAKIGKADVKLVFDKDDTVSFSADRVLVEFNE